MTRDLIRWNPLRNVVAWHEDVHHVFHNSFQNDGRLFGDGAWAPAVDLEETEDAYLVTADLPGVSQKDIKVTLQDHVLTLQGQRKIEERSTDRWEGDRFERSSGLFSRRFTLPNSGDPDTVKAAYNGGVLKVRIQKQEEAKPRQIEVRAG